MRKKGLLALSGSICLALILSVLPFVGACAPEEKPAETIKIGIAAAETGDIGPWWPGAWEVGELTVDRINEDPPLGRPLEAIIDDEQSTPDGAIKTANYLGGQGVVFAVGYESDGLWAALDVIERFGTPTFTHWAGTSKLDRTELGKDRLFFRTCASDTIMDTLYGLYWEDELAPQGYKKVAIMNGTDEASRSTAEEAAVSLEKVGAQIVYTKEFPADQATFSRILADAFAKEPDAIFVACGAEQGSIVMKQWWDSALTKDILWLVPDEWPTPEVLEAITPAEGAFDNKMVAPNPTSGEPLKEYVGESYDIMMAQFKKVYGAGAEPEHAFAINLWDAIIVGALAIQAAGEATPEAVSEYVPKVASPPGVKVYSYEEGKKALEEGKDIDFEGAGSDCNFDEYGNVYPPSSMYMVIDGKWEQTEAVYSSAEQAEFFER